VEEGEEETESRSGLLGTKVELMVSGEHRCSTRRRFEYAKKGHKSVRGLPAGGKI
jgi:hypothetical protein